MRYLQSENVYISHGEINWRYILYILETNRKKSLMSFVFKSMMRRQIQGVIPLLNIQFNNRHAPSFTATDISTIWYLSTICEITRVDCINKPKTSSKHSPFLCFTVGMAINAVNFTILDATVLTPCSQR